VILFKCWNESNPTSEDHRCNLLEYVCKRQRRVVRSTFSGEFNGLIISIELLQVLQMCLHQVWQGTETTATGLAALFESDGLEPECEAVVDARSVFDCLAASDVGELVEGSLKLHVLSIRERLLSGTLHRLWWSDTRDMLADGLTKGSVPRAHLLACGHRGQYKVVHERAQTGFVGGRKRTSGSTK